MPDYREIGAAVIREATSHELERMNRIPNYERTNVYTSTHVFKLARILIGDTDAEQFADSSADIFPIVHRIDAHNHILTASLLSLYEGKRDLAEKIEV